MFGLPLEQTFLLNSTLDNRETITIYKNGNRVILDEDYNFNRKLNPLNDKQLDQLKNALDNEQWEEIEKFTEENISL